MKILKINNMDYKEFHIDEYGNIFKDGNKINTWKHKGSSTVYLRVHIYGKKYYVHRLMAMTYLDNKENKSQVNHIDGNGLNNHISNLEWCTFAENIHHANLYLKENMMKGPLKSGELSRKKSEQKYFDKIGSTFNNKIILDVFKNNPEDSTKKIRAKCKCLTCGYENTINLKSSLENGSTCRKCASKENAQNRIKI